jgi:Bacterial type II/III secretion system short domain/Bacterial type II and III secretion system protein
MTPIRFAGLLAALVVAPALAQQSVLEVITLKYRTAEQVIPLVQPFVDRDGSISGMQNQLIVRTSPANLAEIRKILDQVDARPRQLLITVRQDVDLATARREAGLSGRVGVGDSASIAVPGSRGRNDGLVVKGGGNTFVRGRIAAHDVSASDANTQRVQVLEGNVAFIRVGQSVPVPSQQVVQTPYGTQIVQSTQFRDFNTGFQVLPRVSGDTVTVEINPQRERPGRYPGTGNVQGVSTIVSAPLGEWMEIGGASETGSVQSSGNLGQRSQSGSERRSVVLMVQEIVR